MRATRRVNLGDILNINRCVCESEMNVQGAKARKRNTDQRVLKREREDGGERQGNGRVRVYKKPHIQLAWREFIFP